MVSYNGGGIFELVGTYFSFLPSKFIDKKIPDLGVSTAILSTTDASRR